ncbi:MAG: hypothetical protein RLZZ501_277 [Pseudomonadota bacterium]|jgi:hypothetical protein
MTATHPVTATLPGGDPAAPPAVHAAEIEVLPLIDLGGQISTAYRPGDPTRPGLLVCNIAPHFGPRDRANLSQLFAAAPEMRDALLHVTAWLAGAPVEHPGAVVRVALARGPEDDINRTVVRHPTPVLEEIAAERRRQIEVEGFDSAHDDDTNEDGALARAAGCYALTAGAPYRVLAEAKIPPTGWPWARDWWKPTTRRRDLIVAAALIVAEIERLDRAAAKEG